ncbi:MAG: hypothetical protein ACK5ZG_07700 [Phycisphaerae bacterium]|jgi:hypothetical protein
MTHPLSHRSPRLAVAIALALATVAGAQPKDSELFPTRQEPPAISPSEATPASDITPSIKLTTTALPPDFELPRSATLVEASAISKVTGTIVRVKDQYFFVPDAGQRVSTDGPAVPGLILMPNQRLEQMAAGLITRGDRAAGTITAQVFNYRARTYALVTQFAFAVAEEPAKPAEPAQPASQTPSQPAPADDDVAAIVRELQTATQRPRALARPDQELINDMPRRRTDDADAPPLVSERTVLVRKRGRLVRLASAEGRFAFAFDNDPDSPAPAPMLLQPCAMLQAIEDIAGEQGDNLTFELTGRVTRFGERNYLLPEFFQVARPSDPRGADMRSRQ